MNKVILAMALMLSTLSFSQVITSSNEKKKSDKKPSTLVCKVRKKNIKVGEPGIVRVQADDSGNVEINIDVVRDKVENSPEVFYDSNQISMNVNDMPEGFVKNKTISFKRVAPNTPFASNDGYFVYLKKSFPASIKMTVVNKESGEMTFLPKCYVSDKFLTKIIKL